MEPDWNDELCAQLERHWSTQLRPRLDGLTDEEYFWEPVPGAWNLRPCDGASRYVSDFAVPPPEPPPVTTIAWRLAHLIVVVHGMRALPVFGGPSVDFASFPYAGTAEQALQQLDDAHVAWIGSVRDLGADGLGVLAGEPGSPLGEWTMAAVVLHVHRELIHHGAEICLLRDLYRARACLTMAFEASGGQGGQ